MLPAIGLCRETPERDLMQQPPRLMVTANLFLA